MNLGTERVHQQSPIECGFGESVAVLSNLYTLAFNFMVISTGAVHDVAVRL